jgi:hypothetical protein
MAGDDIANLQPSHMLSLSYPLAIPPIFHILIVNFFDHYIFTVSSRSITSVVLSPSGNDVHSRHSDSVAAGYPCRRNVCVSVYFEACAKL